ncbi:MAG: hypothetical protein A2X18_12475 [Bacteroidetes bacterium GWF2_40_14]|nr:MAG: hypothetical protein A2X18_12475 [Bacteroidetes bacterium GWF2_40_14]
MSGLSSQFNNDSIDNKIKIGSVISVDCDGIDHPKWNIVLDITDDKCLIASVFINTDINFKHINSPELETLQSPIEVKQYGFLDHDSFIDCSQVFEKPYEKYKETLLNKGIVRKKGDLLEADIEKVYNLVRKSKNVTGKVKKKFARLFPK